MKICENCTFFIQNTVAFKKSTMSPISTIATDGYMFAFPSVEPNDFCGEYQDKLNAGDE